MNKFILLIFVSFNSFAQIAPVNSGNLIEATKINEVIQKTNETAQKTSDLETSKKIQHAFPVGTILNSILSLSQFQAVNGNCWRLIDGSSLAGTDLGTITGMTNLPNVLTNGEFLRQAKSGRTVGTLEQDAQQNITGAFAFTDNDATSYRHRVGVANGSFFSVSTTTAVLSASGGSASGAGTEVRMDSSLQARTADEVRPKNLAVNMFIKVNNECN